VTIALFWFGAAGGRRDEFLTARVNGAPPRPLGAVAARRRARPALPRISP